MLAAHPTIFSLLVFVCLGCLDFAFLLLSGEASSLQCRYTCAVCNDCSSFPCSMAIFLHVKLQHVGLAWEEKHIPSRPFFKQ